MALYGLSGSSDGSSEDCTLYLLCVVSMLMLSEYGGTMPARCAHDICPRYASTVWLVVALCLFKRANSHMARGIGT